MYNAYCVPYTSTALLVYMLFYFIYYNKQNYIYKLVFGNTAVKYG